MNLVLLANMKMGHDHAHDIGNLQLEPLAGVSRHS